MARDFHPEFQFRPSVSKMECKYDSASEALWDGNYELAVKLAKDEADIEILGAALIGCGAIKNGLNYLNQSDGRYEGTPIFSALAYWCLGDKNMALNSLDGLAKSTQASATLAKEFYKLISTKNINVTIFQGLNTPALPTKRDLPGIKIRTFKESSFDPKLSYQEIAGNDAIPDLVISLGLFGDKLPTGLHTLDCPFALQVSDFDNYLTGQAPDLMQADIILSTCCYEHYCLAGIYGGLVAAIPSLTYYTESGYEGSGWNSNKDIDIFFSGRSFYPHAPDKARLLFRIATLDDPNLKIRIHDGYLDHAQYRQYIERAKINPVIHRYPFTITSGRAISCLRYGSFIATDDGIPIVACLDNAGGLSQAFDQAKLEENLNNFLQDSEDIRQFALLNEGKIANEFNDLFCSPLERGKRLIKYVLFQTILLKDPTLLTLELRSKKKRASVSLTNASAVHSFDAFIDNPLDDISRQRARSDFETCITFNKNSLTLRFNFARFLWIIGERKESLSQFQFAADLCFSGDFDPLSDNLHSHLIQSFRDMMPYHEYYNRAINDLIEDNTNYKSTRAIIASTIATYQGLNFLQCEQYEDGIERLLLALDHFKENFITLKILTKAFVAVGRSAPDISAIFRRTLLLYPPFISELLPIGLMAEKAMGQKHEAVEWVKKWVYFQVRVFWGDPNAHPIPDQTWEYAQEYFHLLPPALLTQLAEKFPERCTDYLNKA